MRRGVLAGGAQTRQVLGGGNALGRGGGRDRLGAVLGGGRLRAVPYGFGGALLRGGERRLGQRRGEDRGDLGTGRGLRGTDAGEFLGPYGPGDPGPVEHPSLVRLGHQVLGLVVVAVGGLHGPEVDGDAVLLGGHQTGEQISVAGHQHHVGASTISGQLGELGVHSRIDALLRPAAVAAGQCAQPDRHPRHDAQPPVFGLRYAVGGAVEPVDTQQRAIRIGLGELAQALDEGGVVDGDAGTRRFAGEKTRGGAQQISGVHQDNAAVHAFHPLSGTSGSGRVRIGDCSGFPSSLPDHGRVNGRNSITGVAEPWSEGRQAPFTHRNDPKCGASLRM